MKIRDASQYFEALQNLTVTDHEFSVKTGLKIIQNKNKLKSELDSYFELRNEAILKYSDGTGEIDAKVNPKQFQECRQYVQELENEDVVIEFNKIKLSELENIQLPLKTIQALSFMIEED